MLFLAGILFREKQTNSRWKEVTTDWINEYKMLPENSLDVLFLGTSHTFCTVDPNLIWNDVGVTTYNLASSAQDMNATLFYLKEALKTQQPKVVFVEMRGAALSNGTEERWNRLAYDNMPLSVEKLKAVSKSKNENETVFSYIFPIFRYHNRWKVLNKDDFSYIADGQNKDHFSLNGFYIRQNITPVTFEKYDEAPPEKWTGIADDVKDAIIQMKTLCDEKEIDLVLWKAPSPMWRNYYRNAIRKLASENDLVYLDLHDCITEMGIDFQTDFLDANSHMNFSGAKKTTKYLVRWLLNNYEFEDKRKDVSGKYDHWNITYQYYLQTILLTGDYNLDEYLSLIKRPEYELFFAVNDGLSKVPKALQNTFEEFGFSSSFNDIDNHSFLAVMRSQQVIYEKMSEQALSYEMMSDNKAVQMESKGWKVGDDASIKIDGKEYLLNGQRGLGIVVYDKILNKVIDSVTFDVRDNCKCHRNTNIE